MTDPAPNPQPGPPDAGPLNTGAADAGRPKDAAVGSPDAKYVDFTPPAATPLHDAGAPAATAPLVIVIV